MKTFVIGSMVLLLAACAQTTLPTSNNVTDWQVFGKQSALDGLRELSEERIAKLDDVNHATAELIMAYQAGYQQGSKSIASKVLICSVLSGGRILAFVMMLTPSFNMTTTLDECLQQAHLSS